MALAVASAAFGGAAGGAQAAVTPSLDAVAVGQAIVADGATLNAANTRWLVQPGAGRVGEPVSSSAVVGSALDGFPTSGGSFGLLTSGDPSLADHANSSESETYDWGTANADHGDTARDATVLQLGVTVPAGASCLTLDYRFLSEEFPEFVGSAFNDAFIAQVDRSDWTTSGSEIVKPGDFATVADGRPVSVNGVGPVAVSPGEAAGTTYDAATGRVTTKTPITPGAHTVALSIFDQSDSILDSAVFLDNLRFVAEDAATCRPPQVAATPVPEAVPEPAPAPAAAGPAAAPPAPSNAFSVGSSITFGANGTGTMTVTVPGPGVVTAADAGAASARVAGIHAAAAKKKAKALVKPVRVVATKAGKVKLSIRPTAAGRKVLNRRKKLTVRLRVTYTPTGGTPRSQVKKVTLRLKKAHH